jgi:hypothetical protein
MLQRCLSENERFLISGERERAAADYMFTGRGYLESSPANSSSFATAGLMFVFSWGGGSARLTYYSQDATGNGMPIAPSRMWVFMHVGVPDA